MDKVLLKIARQLNAFDEASLMSLWEKYASIVQNFEPTRRWEEACLVFGFIQSVRWKNQLFNYHWAEGSRPRDLLAPVTTAVDEADPFHTLVHGRVKEAPEPEKPRAKAKVLKFKQQESDDTSE